MYGTPLGFFLRDVYGLCSSSSIMFGYSFSEGFPITSCRRHASFCLLLEFISDTTSESSISCQYLPTNQICIGVHLLIVADSGSTASEIALGIISFHLGNGFFLHIICTSSAHVNQPATSSECALSFSVTYTHTHLTHGASDTYLYLDALQFFSHMTQQ